MTDSREPRAAIIGAGLMGRWHADAVRRIGGRVALIVDPNEPARLALGRRYPEARLADSFDPEVVVRTSTAAHVCSPLSTHATIVNALIDAGVGALVEKPFAENADATRRVVDRACERGVIVCPVHQFLFQDGVRRMRTWLPQLGTIRRIEFSACSAGAGDGADPGFDDLVAEILPHPLAIIGFLLGRHVSSATWHVVHPAAGELEGVTTIDDTVVNIAISAHGRPIENVVRVIADKGSASADLYHGFAVRHDGEVSRRRKIAQPFLVSSKTLGVATANLARRAIRREPAYPGLRELVRSFYAAVRAGTDSPIAPAATMDVAVARDKLLASLDSSPLRATG